MKTSQIVSDFRAAYSLHSDDARWTDRYIVSLANICRAKLLHQRATREKLKRTNWVSFCMPLCVGKPLKCPCISEAQCNALIGRYPLPDYISLRGNVKGIEVRTASGEMLDEWSPRTARLSTLNPALANKKGWWIENYRGELCLVVWKTLDWDYIYISMLPNNLDDISAIPSCTEDGITTGCTDNWLEEEFPLDSDLLLNLYEIMHKMLLETSKLKNADDKINETSDTLEP